VAECQRFVPVQPAGGAQGISHHMGGRKGDAVKWGFGLPDGDGLARQMISLGFSFRCRQTYFHVQYRTIMSPASAWMICPVV